jgi:hypothetical protein
MSSKLVAALVVVTVLGACGDGAEVDSRGEPLLTLHANLPTTVSTYSTTLIPALGFTAYITNWGHKSYVIKGDLDGDFPGSFTLRIYDPLPEDALLTMTKGEPALAMGGITAVAPDHPLWLQWTRDASGNGRVCSDAGDCGVPVKQDCSNSSADDGPSNCITTVVSGRTWGDHGYARNYLVLYLASPAPAGGVYSTFFAGGAEIPAGYNVVRYSEVAADLAQSERVAYAECQQRATGIALQGFNAEHGTNYADFKMISNGGQEQDIQLLADWDGTMLAATVAEGCVVPGAQRILDPQRASDVELMLNDWAHL